MALKGTCWPAGRVDVHVAQGQGILPVLRRHFHHHVILVERLVHGGYLALAEGIVKRVVEQLRRDAEARRGLAVVGDHRLQAAILLVAVDVDDDGDLPQLLEHLRSVGDQILDTCRPHGELVERGAVAAAHAHVLRGLQVQSRAGDLASLGAGAA
jgi:hypothetical protein